MTPFGIGMALFLAAAVPARAADAISAYGEFYVQSGVIAKCAAPQDAATRALLAKGDGLRRAALEEFWSELDAVNPTHHRENGLRAQEMLQQERAKRDADIRNYNCDTKAPAEGARSASSKPSYPLSR